MKILIIQHKMIGDVLTTSILFETLKQHYPNSELHYVINTHTFPVVEHNPYIDKFHLFTPKQEKSKLALLKFAWTLRKENYDIVIDAYSKLSSNIISWLSSAKIRISKHKWYAFFYYTHTIKFSTKSKTNAGLAIENRLQLLTPLDISINTPLRPRIYLQNEERHAAADFLKSNSINLDLPLIMISVLGSQSAKTYPFDYMAHVIYTIVQELPKSQILFNYIPKQVADAKAIYDHCNAKTQKHIYFDVFGRSLRDFLAITSHCNALIGNEGGAVNMAKAINIPTFTIFSPWIKKDAWNMFDDGKTHVSVHLKDFETKHYKNVSHPKQLKSKANELYHYFKPVLFKKDIKRFLKLIK